MIKKHCEEEAISQLVMIHTAIKLNKSGKLTRLHWHKLRDTFIEDVEELLENNKRK